MKLPKFVFLFGHRQRHGKDTCCDILEELCQENNLTFKRSSFAKLLKSHAGERYGLDASKMDDQEYKCWRPEWIDPIQETISLHELAQSGRFENVNGIDCVVIDGDAFEVIDISETTQEVTYNKRRSVRDVLIEEGCKGRDIWKNTWCWAAFKEIFKAEVDVGFISDFRFPNEQHSFDELQDFYIKSKGLNTDFVKRSQVKSIQVYRPEGIFKNDGADAELPDEFDKWDFNIVNEESENFKVNLRKDIEKIMDEVKLFKEDSNAMEYNKAEQGTV